MKSGCRVSVGIVVENTVDIILGLTVEVAVGVAVGIVDDIFMVLP